MNPFQRFELVPTLKIDEHTDIKAKLYECNRTIQKKRQINENGKTEMQKNEFKLKGYTIDEQSHILCLDCGKLFMRKNSYNIHKRMFV